MALVKQWLAAVLWAAVTGLACAAAVLVLAVLFVFIRARALSVGALITPLAVGAILLAVVGAAMIGPKQQLSIWRLNAGSLIAGAIWVIGLLFWFGSIA
jgi:hypothetical protein